MAVLVFDDFDRTETGQLGMASTGQSWSILFGSPQWDVNSGSAIWTWNTSDPGGPDVNAALAVIETSLVDGKTSATLVNVESLPTFANGIGIILRYVNTNYFWQCLLYKFLTDSRIRLQRTYAGVGPTTVLDIDIPGALVNGDVLSVGYCGDDFEVFVNEVSLGTYNASSAPQNYGTKSGFVAQTGSWFASYNQRLDNFTVETFGTCTPTYNCTPEGCIDPGDGTGTYATLDACLTACEIPESYNCVDGVCADPGDGSGEFATLADCQFSGCGATVPGSVRTEVFDEGEGSEYYLVALITDSGDELRSNNVKSVRTTGRRTNASAMVYGYDVNDPINVEDLEAGVRSSTRMVTRPQAFRDSTDVAQSERKPVNISNAVLWTVRLEGDDTGNEERDRIDEIVCEVAKQGVRR